GSRNKPVEQVSRELDNLFGAGLLMPPAFYREAWDGGRIQIPHLKQAACEAGLKDDGQALLAQLSGATPTQPGFVSALGYAHRGQQDAALVSVRDEIGRTCARYFDTRQNRWRVSGTSQDLYQFWYNQSGRSLAAKAGAEVLLKPTWQEAAAAAARNLPYSSRQLPLVIHHLLGQLLGWASWCRGVDWRAALGDSHESGNEQFCAQLATIWLIHEAH